MNDPLLSVNTQSIQVCGRLVMARGLLIDLFSRFKMPFMSNPNYEVPNHPQHLVMCSMSKTSTQMPKYPRGDITYPVINDFPLEHRLFLVASNYTPDDLPITPSCATKTYDASPNSTWFQELKWPQHRASILAEIPLKKV